jgi:flagellar protein FliJ
MRINQSERLHRYREFETNERSRRANQIRKMVSEFDRMCIELEQQIKVEETRARINDPKHIAYPTYAKAARERREKLQRSADAFRVELDRLLFESNKAPSHDDAA